MKSCDLLVQLEAYLALENALGFSLRARERLLRDFVAFIQARDLKRTHPGPNRTGLGLFGLQALRHQWQSGALEHRTAIPVLSQRDHPRHGGAQ